MRSAKYSQILFRNVSTETPSRCADAVRLPWVLASISPFDVSNGEPTQPPSETAARRRPIALLHSTPTRPSSGDNKKVNDFLTRSIRHEGGSAAGLNVSKLIL